MATEDNKVTLYGFWASPFVKRAELALELKGIPYEYVEEDLKSKSSLLVSYNPVHKKVPVLAHNGKPICESFVIIEYIEETWKNGPKLLPEDPYNRSQVRFWASYLQQQLFETMLLVLKREGEAQQKALKEVHEKLMAREEVSGIKVIDPEKIPLLWSWITALVGHPVVKKVYPPHEKLVGYFKFIRQNALKSSAA